MMCTPVNHNKSILNHYMRDSTPPPFEKFWLRAVEGMQNVLDRIQ